MNTSDLLLSSDYLACLKHSQCDQYTSCRLSVATWFFAQKLTSCVLCCYRLYVIGLSNRPQANHKHNIEKNVVRMWAAISLGGALRDIPKNGLQRRLVIRLIEGFINAFNLYENIKKRNKFQFFSLRANSNLRIFRPYQRPLRFLPTIHISYHGTNSLTFLESKDHVKYLGVLIDYKLSWKNHIDSITLKLSKTIGLLSKIRHFVPFHTLVSIYNCLVVPYLRYGLIAWRSNWQNSIK